VHANDVANLNAQIVSHNPINSGAAIIEVVVGKNNQHRISALLAFDKHSVATEEHKRLHGVI
jgi:hypothetical protein